MKKQSSHQQFLAESKSLGSKKGCKNMRDLIQSYLSALSVRVRLGSISKRTCITYTQGIKTFARTVGVDSPLTTDTYIAFLKASDSISPSSLRTYKAAVLDFYKHCKLEHGCSIDTDELESATSRYVQKPKDTIPNFDESAVEKLISYALTLTGNLGELRDRAYIVAAVNSGLRQFELCKLTIRDLDFDSGTVKLLGVMAGKGRKDAIVRFSPIALACIRDYLSARASLDSKYPDPSILPLFARHDKIARHDDQVLPIGTSGMWSAIKAVAHAAGIPEEKVWPHALRHYFVTKILKRTGNIKLAQELARHSSIQVTQRYAHLNDADLNQGYAEVFG